MKKSVVDWRCLGGLVVAILCVIGSPSYAAAQSHANRRAAPIEYQSSESAVDAALKNALDNQHIQREMPADKKEKAEPYRMKDLDDISILSQISVATWKMVAYGLLAFILVALAYALYKNRWMPNRSRKIKPADDIERQVLRASSVERMDHTQNEADLLAQKEKFSEAMHLLLLQSVQELRLRLDISIANSLTSREILFHISLSDEARKAFADIIHCVEVSYFGLYQPTQLDYQNCRASFTVLTNALRQERHS